ncbi:hypothetical protein DL96DRAFT_1714726 [Flagelloscypha sp. PMI_526]|nr:hypothetical protein DL96DRAFT_1714726 [Flagelloscypha sp. PMI_526]
MKSFTAILFATVLAVVANAMPTIETSISYLFPLMCRSGPSFQLKVANIANAAPAQFSVTKADYEKASSIIHTLKMNVAKDTVVGLDCSPINVIGNGGNSCSSQPVCCSNNKFNGVIVIGCTPITINA